MYVFIGGKIKQGVTRCWGYHMFWMPIRCFPLFCVTVYCALFSLSIACMHTYA